MLLRRMHWEYFGILSTEKAVNIFGITMAESWNRIEIFQTWFGATEELGVNQYLYISSQLFDNLQSS